MADEAKLLWAEAKDRLRKRVADPTSAMWLAEELKKRAEGVGLVVAGQGKRTFVQLAGAPLPAGVERHPLEEAYTSYAVLGRRVTFRGENLRWVLLAEIARRLPPWARRKLNHRSHAAQVAENLITGDMRSLVRVTVKVKQV